MRKIILSLLLIAAFVPVFSQPAINTANMDLSVKPGDDFFRYANGTWMKNNPVPPDQTRYGAFDELRENNIMQVKSIAEECAADLNAPKGSNKQKIGDFYASGMDIAKINSLGYTPIKGELEAIRNLKSKDEILKHIAYLNSIGIYPLFGFGVRADSKNSTMNIAGMRQSGLTLANRDYYIKDDDRMKKIREELEKHIKVNFKLVGYDETKASEFAALVVKFEIILAQAFYSNLELRDPDKNYNKMNLDELIALCPAIDWKAYLKYIEMENPGDINVGQKDYIAKLSGIWTVASADDLKTYLEWKIINSAAPYLSDDFVNASFEFNGKFMSGAQEIRSRDKRVIDVVNGSLGEALGELYVAKYFPPAAKQRTLDLVANLKTALANRIDNLKWMSGKTKNSKIEITRDSYWQNVINVRKFFYRDNLSELGKPVDKTKWGMSPQTVNAYYSATNNEICFPAGILQPPFFFADGDDAVNYGGIGVVIGHEISHGFDDQGRKFDKDGNLNDWWTEEDAQNFKKQADVLVNQYDNFYVLDTFHVDGKLTLGENIADLGGISISLDALEMAWKKNPPAKEIDGFTPIQRYFLSYAQIWRGNIRDNELLKRLKEDVHSPSEARVNGIVYNVPEFYEAFNIQKDAKMYKPSELRAVIW
ncbi:MAG: M13 family metallopeptidase [Ignavibacteria bacterium]|nr:M13 family metallopeptidase [Ignavibacteria bacterium]